MSTNIEDILAGMVPQTPMQPSGYPPQQLPVNPAQMQPPMRLAQTREERLQRYRDLINNFTYSLGAGLTASANAPHGARNRTMAGVGAALMAPMALQKAQEQFALQQAQEAQRHAQTMAILQGTQKTQQQMQNDELVPLIDPSGKPYLQPDGTPYMVPKRLGGQIMANQANNVANRTSRETIAANTQEGENTRLNQNLNSRATENFLTRQNQQTVEQLKERFQTSQQKNQQDFQGNQNQLNRDAAQKRAETSASARPEPTAIIQTVDTQGNKVTQIVPKVAGKTFAAAPTTAEENRRDQAGIILNYGDHVIDLIDKNPSAVGPILGRLAKGEKVVGNIPAGAAEVGTALGSIIALQPILHGFRGGSQAMDHFNAIIGDQHINAAALKGSIREIQTLARQIRQGTAPPADNTTPAPGSRVKMRANPITGIPEEVTQ